MASFRSPGLDDAVYRLYQRAVAAKPLEVGGRLKQGDLAHACAERLLGKGHEAEFRSYFTKQLRQVRRDLIVARKNEKNLPPEDAVYGLALMERIDRYGSFLRRLNRKKL
ncbi:MAG TPA: hypothetical protein VK689_17895 [Armatimonadota bacterium]|nr:hypothetical protein [Armatimonadota bacterium]